jgi:hypothetical protein
MPLSSAADDALVSVETVGLGGDGTASFEVYGPDGTQVCSGGFGCQLTQTGAHTILISESFNSETVPYSLALNCLIGVCSPPPRTCKGLPVTIQGTDSSDTLIGTPGNDVMTDRVETTCSAAKAATMFSAAVPAEIGFSGARAATGCSARRTGMR